MTERGVRKCLARLEKQGYIKRIIHSGRTKANDYLIPGLNTERRFQNTGTDVLEMGNENSAHILKEKKKEREVSEAKAELAEVSPYCGPLPTSQVAEGQFQNRLAKAFGGGEQGWNVLMSVPVERLTQFEDECRRGSMHFRDAVEAVRTESLFVDGDRQ